jgi:hypothetical protein
MVNMQTEIIKKAAQHHLAHTISWRLQTNRLKQDLTQMNSQEKAR